MHHEQRVCPIAQVNRAIGSVVQVHPHDLHTTDASSWIDILRQLESNTYLHAQMFII